MGLDVDGTPQTFEDAVESGMTLAWHARERGNRQAVVSHFGERTWAKLNANANRLAHAMRAAGIKAGDTIAVALRNRPEFIEAFAASDRCGLRFTPINFHLKADEIGYILDNCEARVFLADVSLGDQAAGATSHTDALQLNLAVGGTLPGFDNYLDHLGAYPDTNIENPTRGTRMLYTSGTTGRPKGVIRPDRAPVGAAATSTSTTGLNLDPDTDTSLCTGPAYHAAPLAGDIIAPLGAGVRMVLMDKWDPEETLQLIERYQVTKCHMVATMFHRLLQLPQSVRERYDLSSLRRVTHGAAPTPVHVKRAMIEWFGPIIMEYYAATEGGGGFTISSEEWLRKPGSVGRLKKGYDNRIITEDGQEAGPNEIGTIYFRKPSVGGFEYYKDPQKTADSYRGDYYTMGDLGYFDDEGYLFLTGRSAELIISGGVNIYPQEIDDVLLQHPAVQDACCIGVPNEEFGEEVKAVVQLRPGFKADAALSQALRDFVREHLASFKVPRSVDYCEDLPRLPSGKIQRRKVREPYWADTRASADA